MSNIAILPANGSRIQVGFLTGQNTSAAKDVQSQLDDKGFPVKATNQGNGMSLTFSQDIVGIPLGKDSGFEFRAGAEISAGLMKVNKDVKTGEKNVWVVDVREDETRYDSYNDRYYTYSNYYSRAFDSAQQAEWYSRQMNYSYNPNGYTYASYPRQGIADIIDSSSKTVGSVKLGVTAGVQKNFSNASVRADALTGYDVVQGNAYVGGRLTIATDYFFSKTKLGIYGQFDKDVTGPYKDMRGQVGVSVGF